MRALLLSALLFVAWPVMADDSSSVQSLVKNLSSGDQAVAKSARESLVGMGQPAVAELQRISASDDPEQSAKANEVLEQFWTPKDLVPADAVEALQEIRQEHDRLSAAGEDKQAEAIATSWAEIRGKIAPSGGQAASGGSETEVHAVGFQHGKVEGTKAERADVEVSNTGAPVVLVLTAGERVHWNVHVAEGAELKMVILTGPVSQVVRGIPASVRVVRKIGSEGSEFTHVTSVKDAGWKEFSKKVSAWAGGEVSSIQGGEVFSGTPVQVGPANPAWNFERSRGRLERLHESVTAPAVEARRAKDLAIRFLAVVHILDHGDGIGPAEFIPERVLPGTLHRTPRPINHVTADPDLGVLYAVSSCGAFQVDGSGLHMEEIAPGDDDDVPDLDRPCGVAFDTKRRRVAVITSGDRGVFYVFDPVQKTWTAPASLEGRTLSGLAYAPTEDIFYALDTNPRSESSTQLVKLSPEGACLGTLRISCSFPCRFGRPEQVVCVPTPDAPDGARFRLVLLGAPIPAAGDASQLVRNVYVVEPSSGRVEVTALQDGRTTGE